MGSRESGDKSMEIDVLERPLLLPARSVPGGGGDGCNGGEDDEHDAILYGVSFGETEEDFVRYQTAQWVLYSLLLVLAMGIGVFMLLYLPVRRYNLRKDFRSRQLYMTRNAIVYKVTTPVPFPFFGVLKKEKHVVLASVSDIIVEQGYLQSKFGIYSIRIENANIRRPPSDDVQILGVSNPRAFRKAVLTHLSNIRSEGFSRQASTHEDPRASVTGSSLSSGVPTPGDLILQKLEEVGKSVKNVQALVEKQSQA